MRRPLLLLFAVLPFTAACHDYEAQHDAAGPNRSPAPQQAAPGQAASAQESNGQPADQQQHPPTPSENFTKNLIAVFANAIQNALPTPGGKMPHGDPQYVRFENLPRPDIASFGLTCNAADLVGRWKWDNANVWLPGSAQDNDAWIDVTPSRITFVVNVKNNLMEEAEKGLWAGMEHLKPPSFNNPLDPPANRTKQRGPVPIVAFDYTLRQTDLCAWELSFQEQVENRQGVGVVQQTCTLAAEYAALGTGTLSDKDDFLWERLNFYDCFPRAEAAQARLDQLGLTLSQGHNGDGFERQHWLQMWSRRRQASWWNQ